MNTNDTEKIEAIKVLATYNERLLNNLPTITAELRGKRKPDTDHYLQTILDVINWEINVLNATFDLLCDDQEQSNCDSLNKETINTKIQALALALEQKHDAAIADALENLTPIFRQLGTAIQKALQ